MCKEISFTESVRNVVQNIPEGSVLSYSEVARKAGFPGAARAVGSLMKKNFDPNIPCHRVVRADGRVGEYNRGGSEQKLRRLKKEGASFNGKKYV